MRNSTYLLKKNIYNSSSSNLYKICGFHILNTQEKNTRKSPNKIKNEINANN
jgi:hypothetical protein